MHVRLFSSHLAPDAASQVSPQNRAVSPASTSSSGSHKKTAMLVEVRPLHLRLVLSVRLFPAIELTPLVLLARDKIYIRVTDVVWLLH